MLCLTINIFWLDLLFLGISPRFRPHIFGENVLSFANFIYLMKSRDLSLLKINEVRSTPLHSICLPQPALYNSENWKKTITSQSYFFKSRAFVYQIVA